MNSAMVSALAAVGGSAVGALAPVTSNVLIQRHLARQKSLDEARTQRESLYSDFIKESSSLYAKAFTQQLDSFQDLVALSALESRIRLSSSEAVVQAAENLLLKIITQFGEPNLSVEELRAAALSAKARPLTVFSEICRAELLSLSLKKTQFK